MVAINSSLFLFQLLLSGVSAAPTNEIATSGSELAETANTGADSKIEQGIAKRHCDGNACGGCCECGGCPAQGSCCCKPPCPCDVCAGIKGALKALPCPCELLKKPCVCDKPDPCYIPPPCPPPAPACNQCGHATCHCPQLPCPKLPCPCGVAKCICDHKPCGKCGHESCQC